MFVGVFILVCLDGVIVIGVCFIVCDVCVLFLFCVACYLCVVVFLLFRGFCVCVDVLLFLFVYI